jgi:high-affinity iron transporter
MSLRLSLCVIVSVASLVVLRGSAQAQASGTKDPADTLRQVAGILDYIGGDYRGAVGPDGSVRSPAEYAEQRALAGDAAALTAQAGLSADDPLRIRLSELTRALNERRDPGQVEQLCRRARESIVEAHQVDLAPRSTPSWQQAEQQYKAQGCNVCHGDDGGAHTPTAAALDPKPANFLDAERVAAVSPHRAFHAISFGVPGTGMRAYTALSDAERWSLAFYVLALRHLTADAASGRQAFEAAGKPSAADARGLSALTEEDLTRQLSTIADPQAHANALAYLRSDAPFSRAQNTGLARAYQQLDAGLLAYERGDKEQARRLFISAYLDGVEPHEAALRARDAQLVTEIESAMLKLRTLAAEGATEAPLVAAVGHARALLDRANSVGSNASTALVGALTITLREGVEIVLLVAALLGLVRKRGHPELAKYVHAGWMLAVPAGLATFYAAESVLSGMQRELAEGLASVLAAFVLLGVTHWLLGQLSARRWVGFLASRIGSAASGQRAALGVLSLAFLAAYREAFEIVLFFQALALDAAGHVREVWLGAALGMLLLGAAAFALLRVGQRLKPAPFMLASSICLAVLSFVLVGKGVRALQAAAVVPITHLGLPELPALGVYATIEGLVAQGLLLGLLLASALLPLHRARRERSQSALPAE